MYESGPAQQAGPDAQLSALYSTPSRRDANLSTAEQEPALSTLYSVPSRRDKGAAAPATDGAAALGDGFADVGGSMTRGPSLNNGGFSGFDGTADRSAALKSGNFDGFDADANVKSTSYKSAKAAPSDPTYGVQKASGSDEGGGGGTGSAASVPVYALAPHFGPGDANYVNGGQDAQYATVAEQARVRGGPTVYAAATTVGMASFRHSAARFGAFPLHPLPMSRACLRLLRRADPLLSSRLLLSFVHAAGPPAKGGRRRRGDRGGAPHPRAGLRQC